MFKVIHICQLVIISTLIPWGWGLRLRLSRLPKATWCHSNQERPDLISSLPKNTNSWHVQYSKPPSCYGFPLLGLSGTVKEREVFKKARTILHLNTLSATSARPPEVPKPKVSGQFEVLSFPQVGQDVSLVLQLTNEEDVAKSLQANMTAWTIVYTGKPIQEVWKESVDVTLGPKEGKPVMQEQMVPPSTGSLARGSPQKPSSPST